MNLADAHTHILTAFDRMNAAYGEPVFDEWVLASMRAEGGSILSYTGPRAENYKQSFRRDVQTMLTELAGQKLAVGDFIFADSAHGTHYDGCLRLGPSAYLFCNHTKRTMTEIRQHPLWREAQQSWAQLGHKFMADPLI